MIPARKLNLGMNNDVRQTVATAADFLPVLRQLFEEQKAVALLYEDSGVTRANGQIEGLYEKDNAHWIRVEGKEIPITGLYAVNGLFTADYSEC